MLKTALTFTQQVHQLYVSTNSALGVWELSMIWIENSLYHRLVQLDLYIYFFLFVIYIFINSAWSYSLWTDVENSKWIYKHCRRSNHKIISSIFEAVSIRHYHCMILLLWERENVWDIEPAVFTCILACHPAVQDQLTAVNTGQRSSDCHVNPGGHQELPPL